MNNWIYNSQNFFKSERNSIELVDPILLNIKNTFLISDEKFYHIMIAVTEAVNNALIHGNKLNPNKTVEFTVKANNDKLLIKVSDQGEGFDPNNIADCTDPANLLKTNGRGVFIIKELMDEVNIDSSSQGTNLEMTFYLKR